MSDLMTEATETGNGEYEQAAEDIVENVRNGGLFGTSNDTEAAGDEGEDDGGEIELDEGTLLERSRQLDQIRIANVEVKKARDAYEIAKRIATSRKADWEESVERLSSLIDVSDEEMPLFDRKPESGAVAPDADLNGAEGVSLSTVAGFPEGVARALEEQADITTVGQLAAYSKAKDLTLLKGVGPAKADAASDAMAAFWADWNSKYPPKADDAGTAV